MSIVEYNVLGTSFPIEKFGLSDIIVTVLIMFIFIAIVEEIIFRSILQTRAEKVFGLKGGIVLSGLIFGIMSAIYGTYEKLLLMIMFGILLSHVFQKTRSIPFILSIRIVANVVPFALPQMLGVSLI